MPMNRINETAIAPPMAFFDRRSSSGIWKLADHDSARMPSDMDSARFMTPRTSGILL